MSNASFQPGDRIFARLKGRGPWPARINPLPPGVEIPPGGRLSAASSSTSSIRKSSLHKRKQSLPSSLMPQPALKSAALDLNPRPVGAEKRVEGSQIKPCRVVIKRLDSLKPCSVRLKRVQIAANHQLHSAPLLRPCSVVLRRLQVSPETDSTKTIPCSVVAERLQFPLEPDSQTPLGQQLVKPCSVVLRDIAANWYVETPGNSSNSETQPRSIPTPRFPATSDSFPPVPEIQQETRRVEQQDCGLPPSLESQEVSPLLSLPAEANNLEEEITCTPVLFADLMIPGPLQELVHMHEDNDLSRPQTPERQITLPLEMSQSQPLTPQLEMPNLPKTNADPIPLMYITIDDSEDEFMEFDGEVIDELDYAQDLSLRCASQGCLPSAPKNLHLGSLYPM